jgi:hypothetical protein
MIINSSFIDVVTISIIAIIIKHSPSHLQIN